MKTTGFHGIMDQVMNKKQHLQLSIKKSYRADTIANRVNYSAVRLRGPICIDPITRYVWFRLGSHDLGIIHLKAEAK